MSAQPLSSRSSAGASEADPRRQSGQHLGGRSVASIAKTFLAVLAGGLLLGFGLAYLLRNPRVPAPGAGPKNQSIPLAVTADSTVRKAVVPISQLPAPVVEKPLAKPAQPAPAVAIAKQPRVVHRPRAAQRAHRQPAAHTRVGTWLRQAREKILPRRRGANDAKHKLKKSSPCKCAFNAPGFSPTTWKA